MSSRGQGHPRHRGRRRGGQLPSFFDESHSSFEEQHRVETREANPTPLPPPDEDVHSDNDLIHEVENYAEGVKGDSQVQALDPPRLASLPRTLSSSVAGTSRGDASHSTSGAASRDLGPRYVCEDWVSRISIEKMASMAREYMLEGLICWPKSNERPHLPLVGFMAISKAILKVGDFLPLHPFTKQVL